MRKLLQKFARMPDSVKSSIAIAFSTFFVRGIGFITTPIFTRVMDKAQYGVVVTYSSWLTIIEVFAVLGLIYSGVFNVGLNENRENKHKYLSSLLVLSNIATLCIFAVLFLAREVPGLSQIMPTRVMLALMMLHCWFTPAMSFWTLSQRYDYKYKLATLFSVLSVVLSQSISLIAVLYAGENQAMARLFATTFAVLPIQLGLYILLFKNAGGIKADKAILKSMSVLALSLLPHYLAQHLISGSDKIMLTNMISEGESAVYSVVAHITMLATILWTAINASLVPFTFKSMNSKSYDRVNSIGIAVVGGYAVICAGVALIGPEIMRILAPETYYYGVYAVCPLAGSAFLSALYNVYANIEFYYKKTRSIGIATMAAAAVNIGLNLVLIPRFGLVGAAYTTFFANVVLIIIHYCSYRRCAPQRIYNDRTIFGITLVTLAVCLCCSALYEYTLMRYGLIALILIVLVIKRRAVISVVRALFKAKKS